MTSPLTPDAIPLFPLGVVLFPDGILPLRIFEVRYLTMIKQCHKTGKPFGVVALTQGREVQRAGHVPDERFHAIGTLAEIIDYQTPQPGLIEIVARGTSRFRVIASERTPHGLWMADVESLPADPHVKVPSDLAYVAADLVRMLEVSDPSRVPPILEPHRFDDAGWVANRWCDLLPALAENRQRMMEMDDPLLRLELVSDLLDLTEFGR
jgi:Lon protease-like protein